MHWWIFTKYVAQSKNETVSHDSRKTVHLNKFIANDVVAHTNTQRLKETEPFQVGWEKWRSVFSFYEVNTFEPQCLLCLVRCSFEK